MENFRSNFCEFLFEFCLNFVRIFGEFLDKIRKNEMILCHRRPEAGGRRHRKPEEALGPGNFHMRWKPRPRGALFSSLTQRSTPSTLGSARGKYGAFMMIFVCASVCRLFFSHSISIYLPVYQRKENE